MESNKDNKSVLLIDIRKLHYVHIDDLFHIEPSSSVIYKRVTINHIDTFIYRNFGDTLWSCMYDESTQIRSHGYYSSRMGVVIDMINKDSVLYRYKRNIRDMIVRNPIISKLTIHDIKKW